MQNSNDQTDQQLSDIKNFYEDVYYADCDGKLNLSRHYFRLNDRLGLSAGQSLLDVACGRGECLKVNQQTGLYVSGIDLSEKATNLSWSWIAKGRKLMWPVRALQALLLSVWPLRWQYQVFHKCSIER